MLKTLGFWCGTLMVLAGAGCGTVQPDDMVLGSSYQPVNYHRETEKMPQQIRRVAVMPLVSTSVQEGAGAGVTTLAPVLVDELAKTRLFEIVSVTPQQLKQWTGREGWTAEEPLPRDFLTKVRTSSGADAVLFARLTIYRPYPPPAIGWSMKLVDAVDGKMWWSVDEVFDAAEPDVTNGARRYSQGHFQQNSPAPDSRAVLQSPSRFGHYTLNAVFGTMPSR